MMYVKSLQDMVICVIATLACHLLQVLPCVCLRALDLNNDCSIIIIYYLTCLIYLTLIRTIIM